MRLLVIGGSDAGITAALRARELNPSVETWHRLLEAPTYLPLGTTAHKQGRIAGETAVGGTAVFAGSLGTQVVKVFELAVARTGLRDPDAAAAGLDPAPLGRSSSTTRPTTPAPTSCTCASPATASAGGCWAHSC